MSTVVKKIEAALSFMGTNDVESKTMDDDTLNDNEVSIRTAIRLSEANAVDWGYWRDIYAICHTSKSKFQDIQIVKSKSFGTMLILDGKIQSATKDEFIYHESLIHPSIIFNYNENGSNKGKRVFIGGGGEFCSIREILKYKDNYISEVIMCDIDKKVCDLSRIYYKNVLNNDMFTDKRLKLIYDDATKILFENNNEKYDIIIMDIADPIDCGPGIKCYYKEFYTDCYNKLNDNGIFITQSGASDIMLIHECFTIINNTLKSVFGSDNVIEYSCYIPSFYAEWGFNIAFKNNKPNWINNSNKIDSLLSQLLKKGNVNTLRYFDGKAWIGSSNMPKFVRELINKETRVASKNNPCYVVY